MANEILRRIPTGPIEEEPFGVIEEIREPGRARLQEANRQAFAAALDGVTLGAHDEKILDWLSGYEPSTVATVCSWLVRARYEGAADEARARGPEAEKPGPKGSHLEREDCPRCGRPTTRDTVLGGSWLHEESGLIPCEK